jgi:hypothetical protein
MDETLEYLIKKRQSDTIFLLKSNSRSEDLLDYPYEILKNLNMRVVRIIDLEDHEGIQKTLTLSDRKQDMNLRIISSAHFLVSSNTLKTGRLQPSKWLDYKIHDFSSLIETIRLLRPERFFWFPHDLSEPFKKEDLPFLPLADCIFAATDEMVSQLKGYVNNIKATGWPRINRHLNLSNKYKNVWFITFFQTIQEKWTPERFAFQVKPLIDAGVMFKFPAWTSTVQYEAAIKKLGGICLNVDETSFYILAQTKLPIITAGSSLELEAELIGKPFVRFHFPLHTFGLFPGKPVGDYDNFDDLLDILLHDKTIETSKNINYFKEEIFLSEVLEETEK